MYFYFFSAYHLPPELTIKSIAIFLLRRLFMHVLLISLFIQKKHEIDKSQIHAF